MAIATLTGCSSSSKGTASADASPAAAASSSASASTSASTKDAASTSGVDVCSLLTAAQATSLNSVTYRAATAGSPASYYKTCTYKNTGSANPVDIQDLTVSVISAPGCWSELQSADGPGKPVSGVGTAAFGSGIGLDVEVGSRCLTISGLTDAELQNNYAPDTGDGQDHRRQTELSETFSRPCDFMSLRPGSEGQVGQSRGGRGWGCSCRRCGGSGSACSMS